MLKTAWQRRLPLGFALCLLCCWGLLLPVAFVVGEEGEGMRRGKGYETPRSSVGEHMCFRMCLRACIHVCVRVILYSYACHAQPNTSCAKSHGALWSRWSLTLGDLSNVVQENWGHHLCSEEHNQELERTKSLGQSAGQRHQAEESLSLGPPGLDCQVSG